MWVISGHPHSGSSLSRGSRIGLLSLQELFVTISAMSCTLISTGLQIP